MARAGWLGLLAVGLVGVGAAARAGWPSSRPALDCAPSVVRLTEGGIARCAEGAPGGEVPASVALALGGKLDLNRVREEELALVPGVGRSLARALVQARDERHGFGSWADVDDVKGVGPARLQALQRATEILPPAR